MIHVLMQIAAGAVLLYFGVCGLVLAWLLVALAVERVRLRLSQLRHRDAVADRIADVAAQGLAERPELADDGEEVARTVLALEEVAELRALARQDGAEAAFVTPGHRRLDAFLDEVLDRRQR